MTIITKNSYTRVLVQVTGVRARFLSRLSPTAPICKSASAKTNRTKWVIEKSKKTLSYAMQMRRQASREQNFEQGKGLYSCGHVHIATMSSERDIVESSSCRDTCDHIKTLTYVYGMIMS
jgi:hypothetical protein